MKAKWQAVWKVLMVVVVLAGVLVLTTAAAQPSAILGTVNFYDGSAAITTTTYSNAPYVGGWGNDEIEIFISADAATSGALTTTVQVSYDNANWINLYSDYLSQSATGTTTSVVTTTTTTDVLTSTGVLTASSTATDASTATSTSTTASAWAERTYSVVLSGIVSTTTSADYINAPVQGLYMRVKLEPSGTITPTVKAVRR